MKRKNYFFDTESIGFFSPTVLIQYAIDDDREIHLHDIFKKPVEETINLIEEMVENNVIGFNLAHDWFHISRTYGVLKELPKKSPPSILDIHDLEDEEVCHDRYCLNPYGALDLMIYGRENELQATMGQKNIWVKRIPTPLALLLKKELKKRVKIPPLYFARQGGEQNWVVEDDEEEGFSNIKLVFYPSTGLKNICKFLLNKDVDEIKNMIQFKRAQEYSWYPSAGEWLTVAAEHIKGWSDDKRRREYAVRDVEYTRDLFKYFGSPYHAIGNYNSTLACSVGAIHWKGYSIDCSLAKKQLKKYEEECAEIKKKVNINSPSQVKKYLHGFCNPIEKILLNQTDKETLMEILDGENKELGKQAKFILNGRQLDKKIDLLKKIIRAGRLYVTFKIGGTKTDRASGGSFFKSRGGSINPQGIGSEDELRNIFTLAPKGWVLDGGDFDGFEVSIFAGITKDEKLNKELSEGKKIHALWGSVLYKKSYEEIYETEHIKEDKENGYYRRSKKTFLAKLYGAQPPKIAEAGKVTLEEAEEAVKNFSELYPGVAENEKKVLERHQAMTQPNGIGTQIYWKEDTQKYVSSLLGYKRYFTMEYRIMKALFELAREPTDEMKEFKYKVYRSDREQKAYGALQSAVFSAAFSIQSKILREIFNHEIQSTGAGLNKRLHFAVWELQPKGIHPWIVMPFNMHDEMEVPVVRWKQEELKEIVEGFIEKYRNELIPQLSMTWKQNMKSWGEK
jgi:DNA polymerase I-like protein with 3'-5' exonuclease and polymerase domains